MFPSILHRETFSLIITLEFVSGETVDGALVKHRLAPPPSIPTTTLAEAEKLGRVKRLLWDRVAQKERSASDVHSGLVAAERRSNETAGRNGTEPKQQSDEKKSMCILTEAIIDLMDKKLLD